MEDEDIEIINFKEGANVGKILLSNPFFCQQLKEIGEIGHHGKNLVPKC